MYTSNSTWEKMEKFLTKPLRVLSHPDDRVGPLENPGAWMGVYKPWALDALEQSWSDLSKSEKFRMFPYIAKKLSAGGHIEQISDNSFQGMCKEPAYLEQLEVLRRAQVIHPQKEEFIMMAMNKNVDILQTVGMLLLPGTEVHVFEVEKQVYEDGIALNEEDYIFQKAAQDQIEADIFRDGEVSVGHVHLLVGNCIARENRKFSPRDAFDENQRILSTIALAIRMLLPGASLIIETHCFRNGFFASCMYVLCSFFKEVSFLKPLAAVDSEMRVYIIAKGYNRSVDFEFKQAFSNSVDHLIYMDFRNQVCPLEMKHFPVGFIDKLATTLLPFFNHVTGCKIRNEWYRKDPKEVNNDQLSRYQYKTSFQWLEDLKLEDVYYAPSTSG